jgi:hypothetical protein
VTPDFDSPNKSHLSVRETTQQRATDNMKWESTGELHRPERAEQMLKQIEQAIKSGASATTGPAQ